MIEGFRARFVCATLLVLHVLPVWAFRYFPTKDGPTHLYNAIALSQYFDHANYLIRNAYQLNLTVFPNWAYSLVALPLLQVFPPLVVEKIILTLAIGLFPLSFLYFHSAVTGKLRVFSLLGFLFSYNYLLIMGFLNFALACSLLFVTLGFWYRHKDSLSTRDAGVLYLLLIALFLTHITPFFLFLVCSSLLLFSRAVRRLAAGPGDWKRALKPVVQWTGVLMPAWFLFFGEAVKRANDPFYMSFDWLQNYFMRFKSLVYFTNYNFPWGMVLLPVLIGAIAVTLREWLKRKDVRDDSIDFLFLAGPLLLLYWTIPWGYGAGGWSNGGWGNDRIHLLLFPLISPWLNVESNRRVRNAFAGILIALCLLHLGWTVRDVARIQPEIEQARSVCRSLPEHSTWNGSGKSVQPGMAEFLSPAYCGLDRRDVVYAGNYEARVDLFPLIWKHAPRKEAQYRIVWNTPPEAADPNDQYEVIAQKDQAMLLRVRSRIENPGPDGSPISGFDMEPPPGLTPQDFVSIGPGEVFRTGGFGWLSPLSSPITGRARASSNEAGMLFGDFLGSRDDGVFMVSLPNGDYEVNSFFFSGDGGSHRLSLIANDRVVVSELDLPAGQYRKEAYRVSVSDNRLIHVIYSLQKPSRNPGLHDHWIWSGFSFKPAAPVRQSR